LDLDNEYLIYHFPNFPTWFELAEEGKQSRNVCIFEYFRVVKKYRIQYPKLPVIVADKKGDPFPLEIGVHAYRGHIAVLK